MNIVKLFTPVFLISLFLVGCNRNPAPQVTTVVPEENDPAMADTLEDDYWAKDNLDLERVGNLLERSDSPEEFERYLNEEDGINNLDLNGDGYVDYISVEEYGDRDDGQRGLSLFSRFGPNAIQEIATLLFYRDGPNYPGSRILINGNEQLYGDNNYYEANWLDRSIGLVSTLFGRRDNYYRSPYYYDNYPPDYVAYEVVDTPIYRTRVERLYPQPVFVYTTAPVFISKIKIKSPNNGLHLGQIKARLVKPTKEQAEFWKNNPRGPKMGKFAKDDKPGRDDPPRSDRGDERGNPGKDDRGAERGNPNKPAEPKVEHKNPKAGKPDNPGKSDNPGGGNPNKVGGNPNKGGGKGGGKGKP